MVNDISPRMTSQTGNDPANGADRSGGLCAFAICSAAGKKIRTKSRGVAAQGHQHRAGRGPSGSDVPACYHATRLHFSGGTKMGSDPGDRASSCRSSAAVRRRNYGWVVLWPKIALASAKRGKAEKKYPAKVRISPLCCHGRVKGVVSCRYAIVTPLQKPPCCPYPVIVTPVIVLP
jgi:hypothetical protein